MQQGEAGTGKLPPRFSYPTVITEQLQRLDIFFIEIHLLLESLSYICLLVVLQKLSLILFPR